MATPEQKRLTRVAQLGRAFAQLDALRSDAERWKNWPRVDALALAMALIDAIACIEERAEPFASARDAWIVDRLREIAIARKPAAEGKEGGGNEHGPTQADVGV